MSDDGFWSSDGHTFVWGEHEHVVKRPPRAADFDLENTDPTQNDKVERWECLDCGLTIQAARALGATFSSRDCPPKLNGGSVSTVV